MFFFASLAFAGMVAVAAVMRAQQQGGTPTLAQGSGSKQWDIGGGRTITLPSA